MLFTARVDVTSQIGWDDNVHESSQSLGAMEVTDITSEARELVRLCVFFSSLPRPDGVNEA